MRTALLQAGIAAAVVLAAVAPACSTLRTVPKPVRVEVEGLACEVAGGAAGVDPALVDACKAAAAVYGRRVRASASASSSAAP